MPDPKGKNIECTGVGLDVPLVFAAITSISRNSPGINTELLPLIYISKEIS